MVSDADKRRFALIARGLEEASRVLDTVPSGAPKLRARAIALQRIVDSWSVVLPRPLACSDMVNAVLALNLDVVRARREASGSSHSSE